MTFDAVIPVDDLDDTLQFFTRRLGFKVDCIAPADDPAAVQVSGHGLTVALQRAGTGDRALELLADPDALHVPEMVATTVVSSLADDPQWVVGRAGMRYRDLVPDRQGGRFIASHIHIPDAGPVPDYVHFHNVRFQMIFCYRGWVELVYEDQGEPFVLHAGDCVLQPPKIRHRVLECSANLEVIEIGCPAEHLTSADHGLALPTGRDLPERDFGGQRFVRHVAADASWHPIGDTGWTARDTGIGEATGGLAGVRVARPGEATSTPELVHRGEYFQFVVLDGTAVVHLDGVARSLGPGDSVVVPAGVRHRLTDCSTDLELLEVSLPAALPA